MVESQQWTALHAPMIAQTHLCIAAGQVGYCCTIRMLSAQFIYTHPSIMVKLQSVCRLQDMHRKGAGGGVFPSPLLGKGVESVGVYL